MDASITGISITPVVLGSRWNAVRNPIVYTFQRMDYLFDEIINSGGFVQLKFNGVDLTSVIETNDSIYFSTDTGNVSGTANVTTSVYSSSNTLVTLDQTWTAIGTIGWLNNLTKKIGHGVNINVYTSAGTLLTDQPLFFSSNISGLIVVDISEVIKSNVDYNNDIVTSSKSWPGNATHNDSNSYEAVYIAYQEYWLGSSESFTADSGDVIYGLAAGLQIPSAYGGNLKLYTPVLSGSPLAKWLTKLERPVMWRTWPFTLSMIISDALTGSSKFIVTPNGFSAKETTAANISNSVRQLYLTNVDDTNINEASYLTAKLQTNDSGYLDVSESIEIELRDATDCNNVMLLGRNSLGGALWWMFEINQEYEIIYDNGKKAKQLTLFATNLTVNQWEALQDFMLPNDVFDDTITQFDSTTIKNRTMIGQQLYVIDQSGNKIGVISKPVANRTRTKQIKHTFEIVIEYPYQY